MVDVQKLTSDLKALNRVIEGVCQAEIFDDSSVNEWIHSKNMMRLSIDKL